MNKRGMTGEEWLFGALAFFAVIVIIIIVFNSAGINIPGVNTGDVSQIFSKILSGGKALIEVIYKVAIPTGLTDDQKMIAFAVFLLVWIIGAGTVRNMFKNPLLYLGISFLVALIASRALNATVIQKYIVGSPVSAAAFLIGILPIMMFYGFISKWANGKFFTKLLIWIVFAVTYLLVFWFGFQSKAMGATYFGAILIGGFIETFAPFFKEMRKRQENFDLGKFMFSSATTLKSWRQVQQGAQRAAGEGRIPGVNTGWG